LLLLYQKNREHQENLAKKSIVEDSTCSKTVTPTVFEAQN
jgi:hypothetical protein